MLPVILSIITVPLPAQALLVLSSVPGNAVLFLYCNYLYIRFFAR